MFFALPENPYYLLIVFVAGIISSIIGGISSGGGSIVTISTMLFLGLPPSTIVATDRFGSIGYILSTTYKFFKSGKIINKYLLPLSALSIVGGAIGANLLIKVNQNQLSLIIGIIIFCLIPLALFKKNAGLENTKPILDIRRGFFLYFISAIYDGFLGIAGGVFVAYLFVFLFGLTFTQANATEKVPLFFNSMLSLVIFAMGGLINFTYGFVLLAANLIGGYIGAHLAVQKGEKFVKVFFIIVCIASAIKLIFFR